ncbi:MAG: hypothetical protein R2849_05525 [Thermomicrobiales bacterium]
MAGSGTPEPRSISGNSGVGIRPRASTRTVTIWAGSPGALKP